METNELIEMVELLKKMNDDYIYLLEKYNNSYIEFEKESELHKKQICQLKNENLKLKKKNVYLIELCDRIKTKYCNKLTEVTELEEKLINKNKENELLRNKISENELLSKMDIWRRQLDNL